MTQRTSHKPWYISSRAIGLHAALMALAVVVAFSFVGCATANVNPQQAKAITGYADFYVDQPNDLLWDVQRFDETTQKFVKVFYSSDAPEQGYVRAAFSPGHYQFRIRFINRVITEPAVIEVNIVAGQISPISVSLVETGTANVRTKSMSAGPTAYGRYGRRTKIGNSESTSYQVIAEVQSVRPYQPKEKMSYHRKPEQ